MPAKLGEAFIAITTRDETDAGYNAARQKANGFVRDLTQGITQGIGQAIARGIGNLLRAGIEQIGESIGAASDLNESINKVGVALADSSQEILDWSKNSEKALLLSRQAALESASSFGILFRQVGIGTQETASMSERMVQLAADLASINNIPVDEALEKLRSGLVGEVRPLRDVGILLNDEVVTREAVNEGLATSTKNVSDQAKVLARYNLILQQTALQQGDVARTLEGTANQQREFAASIEDIQASLGSVFEPIYNVFLRNINKLIQDNKQWGAQILESFATGLASGIRSLIPFFSLLRGVFSYWMQPHSPPKFLPDLDKWGRDALKVYLSGWTKGDFSELKELGSAIEGILRGYSSAGKIGENDLVSRVFGSTQAIAKAVDEFRRLGSVSAQSLLAIQRAAGPAGESIAGLVSSYFDLQKATKAATDAQNELNDITRRYDNLLDPLQQSIDAVGRKQQDLRDAQRVDELNQELSNPLLDWSTRQQDVLELQRLELERQQRAIEAERDTAVDAVQDKVDATKKEQEAAQETFDKQQAALDQQTKINELAGEQIQLDEQAAAKRKAAADEAARLAEQLHDAMLAYQLSLSDTSGKIAILRGELGKTKEGSAEYFQLLEQIKGLEQQQADESKRKADTLHDAQLAYNLALTDTAGQIAIWRDELAKTTPGTADYFDILTRIVNLQKSLEGGGGAGGIGPIADALTLPPEVEQAYRDVADAIQDIFDTISGNGGNGAGYDPLRGTGAPSGKGGISQSIKDFVDALDSLAGSITAIQPALANLGTAFGILADIANFATGNIRDNSETDTEAIGGGWLDLATLVLETARKLWLTLIGIYTTEGAAIILLLQGIWALIHGDLTTALGKIKSAWDTHWGLAKELLIGFFGETYTAFTTWFSDVSTAWTTWLNDRMTDLTTWLGNLYTNISTFDLAGAGGDLLDSFLSGLTEGWKDISKWWGDKMQWLLDQIPKLPSWLGGGSVVPSSYMGPSLSPSAANLGASASSSSVTHDNSVAFAAGSIVVQASSYADGQAAADGLLSKLRSKGIRVGV